MHHVVIACKGESLPLSASRINPAVRQILLRRQKLEEKEDARLALGGCFYLTAYGCLFPGKWAHTFFFTPNHPGVIHLFFFLTRGTLPTSKDSVSLYSAFTLMAISVAVSLVRL